MRNTIAKNISLGNEVILDDGKGGKCTWVVIQRDYVGGQVKLVLESKTTDGHSNLKELEFYAYDKIDVRS